MDKFSVRLRFRRLPGERRVVRFGIWLMGGLLFAATPAGALLNLPQATLPAEDEEPTQHYAEVIRAIESSSDVTVFPIQVVGPVIADATQRLANKIAMASGQGAIAVIYPDMGEPYRSVFAQIIEGIQAKSKGQIAGYAVGANSDIGELKNALRRQDTKVVIALGRQGMKIAATLDGNIGVVVGGVLTVPESEVRDQTIVNSLSPDPALLFARLKGLKPAARRVFTVFDPRQNGWLIQLAKEGARAQGLELVAYEAQDLRSAMRIYQEILASADPTRDALWLPQDPTTVEEGTVLPMVLQESWTRNLAVFSSSFGHVRRGVLFSLYPNNVELGRHLAGSALGFMASGEAGMRGMVPLREVLMAVNLRTAQHLGLDASRQHDFDMVFPER
ncbi:MAG: hypothetical protein HY849_02695 [Nitrosomonadales bacterium]|nr:hypothetical protein [Nitrosomonadales bacterium]